MNNTLKTEPERNNQKDESFEESFIEKFFAVIGVVVEFVWGCFMALLWIGILFGILYGLNYIGVASTITATIWRVVCGAGAIIFGLVFFGQISMIRNHTSLSTMPVLFFAMAMVFWIFFVRVLLFS